MNASTGPRTSVIYECPECETRSPDERCSPDSNIFTRRIGPDGSCPHCDESVAQPRRQQCRTPDRTPLVAATGQSS